MPTVSVIMNCHNGEKYLREAIDSVYAQTFTDWEIILWDDDSTDSSGEIARSYDEKLQYFKGKKAVSLGQARNYALKKAKGEFIAFLDQDDLWMPRHLDAQHEAFLNDNLLGMVYTDTLRVVDSSANVVNKLSDQYRPATGDAFYELVPGPYIAPSMAMVRRQVLDDVGCFNESYNFIEESDLFLRIAYKYRIFFVPDALTIYRFHSQNYSRRFLEQEAEYDIFQKNILKRYPSVVNRLPRLPLYWQFSHKARFLRWHIKNREYLEALKACLIITWITFKIPDYAGKRFKDFFKRFFSKARRADWMA